MKGAPGAHSYTINVAENGRFLFRTEENNAANRNQVLEAITKAFPAHEGYEVSIVDWPARSGAYTVVHSPKDLEKPEPSEVEALAQVLGNKPQ